MLWAGAAGGRRKLGDPRKVKVMESWENCETTHPGKHFLVSLAAGYNQASAARLLGVF